MDSYIFCFMGSLFVLFFVLPLFWYIYVKVSVGDFSVFCLIVRGI